MSKRKTGKTKVRKNRLMVATTLTEKDVLNLIFHFTMGSLPRESARKLDLSVPTCYRFHRLMLARLYNVGYMVTDEGVSKMMADDPGIRERFATWKEDMMRKHRGFQDDFKRQVESLKYNSLYMHIQVYERTYAADMASKANPTEEDDRLAKTKIIQMAANDLVRIILQTGPLNTEPTDEQLLKAYKNFSESFSRKVVKFKK